ncbi:hypothetical protein TNCV_3105721 [Trichonephila clavipes]|nr:hypothetical protein TNCV_3105721 [Trichonephila clavipes]
MGSYGRAGPINGVILILDQVGRTTTTSTGALAELTCVNSFYTALASNQDNNSRVQDCREPLSRIPRKVVFQWVPSRCSLWGNWFSYSAADPYTSRVLTPAIEDSGGNKSGGHGRELVTVSIKVVSCIRAVMPLNIHPNLSRLKYQIPHFGEVQVAEIPAILQRIIIVCLENRFVTEKSDIREGKKHVVE